MLAMMFVAMPGVVIGGIVWDCRRRMKADPLFDAQPEDDATSAGGRDD